MFIDIKDIAREGIVVERVVPIGSLKGDRGERIPVGETRINAFFSKGRRGVEFSCELESSLELQCVRCLETFVMPLLSDFHLVFVNRISPPGTGERQLGEEDCEIYPVSEGRVDLALVIREQIYLSVPLKPLCRESCRGLCPRCGINRNVGQCDCDQPGQPAFLSTIVVPFPREPKR